MASAAEWRAWLKKNHHQSAGVWLVFPKSHTGTKAIEYEEAVRAALCYGWIDSLVRRIDDDRYERKFTPRRPASPWSDLNRRRWSELHEAGLLAPAGLNAAPTEKRYGPRPVVAEMPEYFAEELKKHPQARKTFEALTPSCRKQYTLWVDTAKREETRARRLREAVALLEQGKPLGLK